MKKTVAVASVTGLILLGGLTFYFTKPKTSNLSLNSPATFKEIVPSETSIEYIDPSGFSFSYPDNLSLTNNLTGETPDPDAYADLQIFSKDKSGSLSLRITDSKLATISGWLKENNIADSNTPSEKKLGDLNALEVKTTDRLMLGALDQGILFTVEYPLIEQAFWTEVYKKVIAGFTFASTEAPTLGSTANASTGEEIIFEGEEVVE